MVNAKLINEERKRPRWWCGGVAGSLTAMVVFPLDLIETRMQLIKHNLTMIKAFKLALQKQGFLSLYDGFSASVARQITHTALRFHLYEKGKGLINETRFFDKVFVAASAGLLAGCVGIPLDLCVVRMQADRALPTKHQRRYKNVFHAIHTIFKQEGFFGFYHGATFAFARGAVLTVGQNAVYDQAKRFIMKQKNMKEDSKLLHLLSSITAGFICAPLIHPLEIFKTVYMQRNNENFSFFKAFRFVTRFGFGGFFRGFLPMSLRLIPATIILFVSYEQLRIRFGYLPENVKDVNCKTNETIINIQKPS